MTDALLYMVGVTLADHGTNVRDACEAAVYLAAARTSDPRAAIEAVNSARFRLGAEPVPQVWE